MRCGGETGWGRLKWFLEIYGDFTEYVIKYGDDKGAVYTYNTFYMLYEYGVRRRKGADFGAWLTMVYLLYLMLCYVMI